MPKQMPGYAAHQEKLEAARRAHDAEIQRQKAAATAEEERKRQAKIAKAQNKLADKILRQKKEIISKGFKLDKKYKEKYKAENKPTFPKFLKGFFATQAISFLIGSMAYAGVSTAISSIFDDDYYNGHWVDHDELRDDIYGDISYVQAIKNAYLLDDWRHGKGGVGQGIVGMTSMLLSIIIGTVMANKVRKNNYPKFHYELAKDDETRSILKQLEQLKNYGIDAPKLIKDLTPSINKILESLSKIDRGYFDNLAAGGLDKANYETCVAIISGYLKSHPKEYNKIIGIINEATLPPEIVKKYGKGNTISFAGAQAIVPER